MRRVISAALAMVMVMAISIPAFAIDKEREVSRLAYMNLDQASEAMQEKILQAREEIIFSKSWVADGLQGFVYDKDGNVIEEVPQFSEIFPADWDAYSRVWQHLAADTLDTEDFHRISNAADFAMKNHFCESCNRESQRILTAILIKATAAF